jgi:hypothetical protein
LGENKINVCIKEGTGNPRRCAIHTASGSMDAAASDASNILRGVLGMIIEETRMTIVIHDTYPSGVRLGTLVLVLRRATPTAFSNMYQRPASVFTCTDCFVYRTHAVMRADARMAASSIATLTLRTGAPTARGVTSASMTRPYVHKAAATAENTPSR